MNIVAIDPSLSCTALVVNNKMYCFTNSNTSKTAKGELKKWFQVCKDNNVAIYTFSSLKEVENHSVSELNKIRNYYYIVNDIIRNIKENIDVEKETKIFIEGYSYSSIAGPLIDLVTFGSLLRLRLIQEVSHNITVIPPSSLKQEAAKLTYSPTIKGSKTEYRNNEGVAGGKFTKREMFLALIENESIKNDEWISFLRHHSEEILSTKNIPKPIEDLNDAKLLYECHKNL